MARKPKKKGYFAVGGCIYSLPPDLTDADFDRMENEGHCTLTPELRIEIAQLREKYIIEKQLEKETLSLQCTIDRIKEAKDAIEIIRRFTNGSQLNNYCRLHDYHQTISVARATLYPKVDPKTNRSEEGNTYLWKNDLIHEVRLMDERGVLEKTGCLLDFEKLDHDLALFGYGLIEGEQFLLKREIEVSGKVEGDKPNRKGRPKETIKGDLLYHIKEIHKKAGGCSYDLESETSDLEKFTECFISFIPEKYKPNLPIKHSAIIKNSTRQKKKK